MKTTARRFDVATARNTSFEVDRVTLQDAGIWSGMRVEQWEGIGKEIPETVLYQHGLLFNLDALKSCEVRWSGTRPTSLVDLAPGTVGIFPAGVPYRGSSRGPTKSLVIAFDPGFLRSATREAGGPHLELMPRNGILDPFLLHAAKALATDIRDAHPYGALYGESIAVAMAAHLTRFHSTERQAPAGRLAAFDVRKARIRDYVFDNLDDRLTLERMANFLQLDPYTFSRWFKAAFGTPPYRYVLLARIERSKVLLASSDAPLTKVALDCGFDTHSHFSASFRRVVGTSPSTYRAVMRRSALH